MGKHRVFGRWGNDVHRRQHERADGHPKKAWPAEEVPRVLAELRERGDTVAPYRCSVCGWWHFGNDYTKPKTWHPADELDLSEIGPRVLGNLRAENFGSAAQRRGRIADRWRAVVKRARVAA
jgi:hypothetical protein